MKFIIFQIHDAKADGYLPAWETPNVAMGIRIFQQSVMDPNTQFARHPGDYSLMETGDRDQETGIITDNGRHIDHGTARQHKSRYILENEFQETHKPEIYPVKESS